MKKSSRLRLFTWIAILAILSSVLLSALPSGLVVPVWIDSSGSLGLGTAKAADLAADNVGTSTTDNTLGYPNQRNTVYAASRFWVFHDNGTDYVAKSSLDGDTWSSATVIISGLTDGRKVSIWYDSDNICLAYATGVQNEALQYRQYTPNEDGTLTALAGHDHWETALAASASLTYKFPYVTKDTSRYPVISYICDNTSDTTPYVVRANQNDGTWTTDNFNTQLSATNDTTWAACVLPVASQDMMAIYARDGQPVKSKIYDYSGSAFLTENTTIAAIQEGCFFSAVVTSDNVAHLVFSDNAEDIVYTHYHSGGTAWETEEDAYEGTSATMAPVLSRTLGDNLYLFWMSDPDTDHIYYRRYLNGVWDLSGDIVYTSLHNAGSDFDWLTESGITSNHSLSAMYEQTTSDYLALVWLTGAVSPYNVRFAARERSALLWEGANRIKMTISGDDVPSALTGEPIAIYLDNVSGITDYDTTVVFDNLTLNGDRFKIAITEADGLTQLYGVIEYWRVQEETAILWVGRDDFVIPADGCVLWLYYDSTHPNNPNITEIGDNAASAVSEVWGKWRGVWNMAENHWGFARNGFAGYYYADGPSIVYDNTSNKAYIAWQGDKAASAETYLTYPWVTEYDIDSDAFAVNTMVRDYAIGSYDTHGGPAIMLDTSGYLHCVYGGHASTSAGRYSITDDPNDSTSWTYMGEFPWVAGDNEEITYPQFCRTADGTIYLTYRSDSAGGYLYNIMRTLYRGTCAAGTDATHLVSTAGDAHFVEATVEGAACYVWTSGDATGAQQTIAADGFVDEHTLHFAGATAGDQYVIWSVPTTYLSNNNWSGGLRLYSFGPAYDPDNKRLWFSWGWYEYEREYTATSSGTVSAAGDLICTDNTKTWGVNDYQYYRITNTTTGAFGWVESNTATTATPYAMNGGMRAAVSDNTWDVGDTYKIGCYPGAQPATVPFVAQNREDMFVAFMDLDSDSATYMHCFGLGDAARGLDGGLEITNADATTLTTTGYDCGTEITCQEGDAYCNVFHRITEQNEMCPRLHIDSLGYPHIMYARQTGTDTQWYAGTNASAYYQRWDGTEWTTPVEIAATGGKWTVIDFYIVPDTGGATTQIYVPITDATTYLKMYYSDDGGATWTTTTALDWTRSYFHGGLNTFAYTPELQYSPTARLTMSMSLYVDAFVAGPNEVAVEIMCICDDAFRPVLTGSGNTGYIDDASANNYKARKKAARSPTGTAAQPADLLTTGIKGGKYGIANVNTLNHLKDTTLDQFTAADEGKTVYNLTDSTSGTIVTCVAADDLLLDGDVFPDGNEYYRIGGNEVPIACSQFEPGGTAEAAGDWAQVYCAGSGATKLEPTAGMVIRGWVLYHDHPSSQDSSYLSFMYKASGTTGFWTEYQKANDWWYGIFYTTGGTAYGGLKTIPSWEANQWHHIMAVYDSVSTDTWAYRGATLWLDGVLMGSTDSAANKFIVHAMATDMLFAATGTGSGSTMTKGRSHDGAMDDLMIGVPADVTADMASTMYTIETDSFITYSEESLDISVSPNTWADFFKESSGSHTHNLRENTWYSSDNDSNIDNYTLTNNSSTSVDVSISSSDNWAGVGVTWDVSSTGDPGNATIGLWAGAEGSGGYYVLIKPDQPPDFLVTNLAVSGTQKFGLKVFTCTDNAGNVVMTGTITLWAVVHT